METVSVKRRRGYGRAVLALVVLGTAALAIFGGSFGRGVAVGAIGSLAAVGLFVLFLRRLMTGLAGRQLEVPPLPVAAWDYAMVACDLAGEPIAFEQFRNRVLVLNFWGTWCAPCIAEMPSLFRLQERTGEEGVELAFVSNEKREVLKTFVEKRGWTGRFYQLTGDTPECFRTRAIPATFVIDRTGGIVLRHFGAARWDDDSIVVFLRGLALPAA